MTLLPGRASAFEELPRRRYRLSTMAARVHRFRHARWRPRSNALPLARKPVALLNGVSALAPDDHCSYHQWRADAVPPHQSYPDDRDERKNPVARGYGSLED